MCNIVSPEAGALLTPDVVVEGDNFLDHTIQVSPHAVPMNN